MNVYPEPGRGEPRQKEPRRPLDPENNEDDTVQLTVPSRPAGSTEQQEARHTAATPHSPMRRTAQPRWLMPLLGGVLLCLASLGMWAFTRMQPQSATVARRDIVSTVLLDAQIVVPPSTSANLHAPYASPVAQVFASVGQRVRRGDSLVELSLPEARNAYDQARAEVKAVQAEIAQEESRLKPEIDAARQALVQAKSAERAVRASGPGDTATASGETSTENSPTSEVVIVETSPAGSPDISEELARAIAARTAAEQAYLSAKARRETALLPLRKRLNAARAAFSDTEQKRKTGLVRTPISGTVLALNTRPGEEVSPPEKDERGTATPLATVVDLDRIQVHAPIPSEHADVVRKDQPVNLVFESLPGQQFEGTVHQITVDASRRMGALSGRASPSQIAIIRFQNTQGLVKPDTPAPRVLVRVGEARDAISVPAEAVDVDPSARSIVKVLRDGQWVPVVVETGLSDGRFTAIKGDIKEGDTVQVTPKLL